MRTPWAFVVVVSIASALSVTAPASAGRIVINHDEWTLSNRGFIAAGGINDPGVFIDNVMNWFTGGVPAVVHAWSTNEIMIDTRLHDALIGGGHTYTNGITGPFNLARLEMYDAIILAGDKPPGTLGAYSQTLIDYVEGGGNVYIAGGTGVGGAPDEAARWNAFLNHFGFGFGDAYNVIRSTQRPILSTHPIFDGVDHLYDDNGNTIFDLEPLNPDNQILVTQGAAGLYAVYDPNPDSGPGPGPIPVPGTALLVVLGFGALALSRSRRKR
jgi:hypothetical protein